MKLISPVYVDISSNLCYFWIILIYCYFLVSQSTFVNLSVIFLNKLSISELQKVVLVHTIKRIAFENEYKSTIIFQVFFICQHSCRIYVLCAHFLYTKYSRWTWNNLRWYRTYKHEWIPKYNTKNKTTVLKSIIFIPNMHL